MIDVTENRVAEVVVPEIAELRSRLADLESNLRQADSDMIDMNLPVDVRYRARKRRKSIFVGMCMVNQVINNFYIQCHVPKNKYDCERFGHSKNKESSCMWCGKDNAEIKKEAKENGVKNGK